MIYNKITRKLEIRVVWGNIPIGVRDEINNGLVETKSFDLERVLLVSVPKPKRAD